MRLALIAFPLLAVALACDAAPKKRRRTADTTQPVERACSVQNCFMEREVRDFEVVDPTTVIVYVGSQRCPFRLNLRGTFCDVTFAPQLYFHSPRDIDRNDERDLLTGTTNRLADLRVCSNDIGISVDGGVFTESPQNNQPTDRFGNQRSECQIASVASITDDEIVQMYVEHGVAPPPPMGSGEIEVGEQDEEAAKPAETTPAQNAEGEGAANLQSAAAPGDR